MSKGKLLFALTVVAVIIFAVVFSRANRASNGDEAIAPDVQTVNAVAVGNSSGCPDTCWLSLGVLPNQESIDNPLAINKPGQTGCQPADPSAQANCWPANDQTVTVICQVKDSDGTVWFAVAVPTAQAPDSGQAADFGNNAIYGWNRQQQFKPTSPPHDCPAS